MHFNIQKPPSKDAWIPNTVQTYFMEICYLARTGYQRHGAGLVLYETDGAECQPFSRGHFSFLSLPEAVANFERLEFFPKDVQSLSNAIATYDPNTEIILMLTGAGEHFVSRLENLKILPEEAYQQVCSRWDEYSLVLGNPLKI